MNGFPSSQQFANTDELLAYFNGIPFAPHERIAIVAGHFMLMYDEEADAVVPMVHQDARNKTVAEFSKEMAGGFPVLTFKLGVRLYQQLLSRQLRPKVVLAVNDHKFQSKGFQARYEPVFKQPEKVANLRKQFYQDADIPNSFKNIMAEEKLVVSEIIQPNEIPHSDKNRLGHRTNFFSEKAMRNTFDRRLLNRLKKDERFRYERRPTEDDPASYALYYKNDVTFKEVCLTEDGSCGCAGELLEFYIELEQLGFTKIIFFVPQECLNPVNVGTFISTTHSTPELTVYTISGLGGMGITLKESGTIELSVHKHERGILQT